jgi:hypothetical protein
MRATTSQNRSAKEGWNFSANTNLLGWRAQARGAETRTWCGSCSSGEKSVPPPGSVRGHRTPRRDVGCGGPAHAAPEPAIDPMRRI